MTDAFGIVAMVAMTPLIIIQLLGLIYGSRMKSSVKQEAGEAIQVEDAGEIIEYGEESSQ
jgi:hypothetical protein